MLDSGDRRLLLCAFIGAALVAVGIPRLWPLMEVPIGVDEDALEASAMATLTSEGFDLTGYTAESWLTMAPLALDFVERTEGRPALQKRLRDGDRLARYSVRLKKPGESSQWTVDVTGDGRVLSYRTLLRRDAPGATLDANEARARAGLAVSRVLNLDVLSSAWVEVSASTTQQTARADHVFKWERTSPTSELKESIVSEVSGDQVTSARIALTVPPSFGRSEVARSAPARGVEAVGFLLAIICGFAAFFIFLQQLGQQNVRLKRAGALAAFIFCGLMAVWLTDTAQLFRSWDPLLPRWLHRLDFVVGRVKTEGWQMLLLLAVIGAADALDRNSGANRGKSLWRFLRGRWTEPAVGAASARGFLLALVAGGVMSAIVILLQTFAGAEAALQPRGIFLTTINSAFPASAAAVLFLNAALVEEIGYRFFGGTWLLGLSKRKWVAILVPALVFGLSHARQDFLPPADPFWARPLVMTCVGLVWGWALFKYDALTLVLSHWVADLLFFSWPRLACGEVSVVVPAALACLVPLIPAILSLPRWLGRGGKASVGPPAPA
jgi:hypothetical protein